MTQILIDTNVLVYFFDLSDTKRQARAVDLLKNLEDSHLGTLSTQNLAEFFNVATRKLAPVIPTSEAKLHVEWFMQAFTVLPLTSAVILEAARGVCDHKLAYYDAQLWATAKLNQIPVIFSEDFQDGTILEGVRFVNPFKPGFEFIEWV